MSGKRKGNTSKLTKTTGTGKTRCPFFASHSATDIRCEGVMDGVSHGMHFKEAERKAFYKRTYCDGNYQACEYYRMLMTEKYDEQRL